MQTKPIVDQGPLAFKMSLSKIGICRLDETHFSPTLVIPNFSLSYRFLDRFYSFRPINSTEWEGNSSNPQKSL